jgi:hypothetical protein
LDRRFPASFIGLLDKHFPDPFTAEVLLSLALALVLPVLLNLVYRSEWCAKRAARNAGEHMELVVIESLEESKPIEVSLQNRKIYMGWAVDTGVGSSADADVAMVPMFSGYRDEDTLDSMITMDYAPVIRRNLGQNRALDLRDFRVVIPMSEIVSVRLFDEDVYNDFSMGRFDAWRRGALRRRRTAGSRSRASDGQAKRRLER